jgi:hypothetical protein
LSPARWIALACRLLRARRRATEQRDGLATPHLEHHASPLLLRPPRRRRPLFWHRAADHAPPTVLGASGAA